MYRHNFLIAASILLCLLIQTQGADKYTDENRPYEFGFKVEVEGMKQQHRHEEKDKDGIIKGEFGFITADDVYHVTVYATDKDGHFKILSMKNIHLKSSTTSAGGVSSSPRQGHALTLAASTKTPFTPVTSTPATATGVPLAPKITPSFQTQAISTFTNNAPPQQNAALKPQTSFTPVPEPSPVKACSGCSLPTSPKPPPAAPQVNDFYQNQHTLLSPVPPSLNNLQPNSISQPINSKPKLPNNPDFGPAIVTNAQISPRPANEASYSSGLSNEQFNGQTPSQSAYPAQKFPQQTVQANPKSIPQQSISFAGSVQNYPNQPSQSSYPQQVPSSPNNAGVTSQLPSQSSYPIQGPSSPNNRELISQQPSQSSYPIQGPSVPNNPGLISQQPSQSSYPLQVPSVPNNAGLISKQPSQSSFPMLGPFVRPNPQQISQSSIPVQGEVSSGIAEPNYHQTSQSSYPVGGPLASIQPTAQKPSQATNLVVGNTGGTPQLNQANQSTYPIRGSSIDSSTQPKPEQQGGYGEREPKQYDGLNERQGLGLPGQTKPKLVSADMQIVDKNTDIHALQPGEKEGLPAGLSEHDMSRLLYTFNYRVGFHGHFEEGYENGVKKGYYYVTGRNGVRTRIDYVADGTGFHPKVSQEVLDLLSDDVPKPETEKDAKYGLKNYEFKWLYYPVGS